MSSKVLDCETFRGNNPLTGDVIWKHRVSGGSEAIKEKLKELYLWDGSSNIATIAAKLKDGKIESWHLYLFGRSKGIKVESGTFLLTKMRATLSASRRSPWTASSSEEDWCPTGCPLTSSSGSIGCHMRRTPTNTTV
jgi:hypothetical protein